MKFHRSIVVFLVLAMFTVAVPLTVQGDTTDDATISITDSRGVITNLTGPAAHVASFGAFATNTLVDIGMLDKAVIFDASSEFNKSAIPEMQGKPAEQFITVSSMNSDLVVQKMLYLADHGTWNRTTDVIFGYGYDSLSPMWSELEGLGFIVITFYPNSYDGIVQVVRDIESVTGADHDASDQMVYVKEFIAETLEENGVTDLEDKVTAVYVSYSGGKMYLGNHGSVTVDFIIFAGAVNSAQDEDISANRYEVDLTYILQLNPQFVLLDGYYTGTAAEFSDDLGNEDITVYKLNKSWNSYCPDASEGLWTVACLFYPDYFEGELPVNEMDQDGNGLDEMVIYAAVGIVVIIVAVALVLLMRRKE